jgi:hypothetical protein
MMMVMERAPKERDGEMMFVASSDWGPRTEGVGGAQPGAERR